MIVSLRDMFFKDLSLVLTDQFIVDRYCSVLFVTTQTDNERG